MVNTRSQRYGAPGDDGGDIDSMSPSPGESDRLDATEEDTFQVPNPTPNPAESHAFSASPFTPTPTPTYSNSALTLKLKRESAKAGRWQTDEATMRELRSESARAL